MLMFLFIIALKNVWNHEVVSLIDNKGFNIRDALDFCKLFFEEV